jgi:hypothetical protein
MTKFVRLFTLIVATGLMALTIKGAYALTSSVAVTVVLSALVVIQWASARRALMELRKHRPTFSLLASLAPGGLLVLWFAAATITVSFVGSELFQIFSANSTASGRFEAEQSRLTSRAREIETAYGSLDALMNQYAAHARQMADQEVSRGGSCAVNMGIGPGEIRAFRQSDANSAASMVAQLQAPFKVAKGTLAAIKDLSFQATVPELRRQLTDGVSQVNTLRQSPMLSSISAFTVDAKTNAGNIQIGKTVFQCTDTTRDMLLTQLKRAADAVASLPPLPVPELLDPTDARAIAQGTLVRTWAGLLELLPQRLTQGKSVVAAGFKTRFAIDDTAILGASNLPLILAWVLESILLGLIFLDSEARRQVTSVQGPFAKLTHWAVSELGQRSDLLGRATLALISPLPSVVPPRAPYVDLERLFADDAMEDRACTVARWYRPYGKLDIVTIPLTEFAAIRAARELMRAGLLARVASGIDTTQLARDNRLAGVMAAIGGEMPDTVWEVYRVIDDDFARWLLSQPVEARGVLGAL